MRASKTLTAWLRHVFVALAFGIAASATHADSLSSANPTIYLPGPGFTGNMTGAFQFDFAFALAQNGGVSGSFSWFDSQDVWASNIDSFSATLRSADGLTVFATSGGIAGTDLKSSSFLAPNLAAGNYLLRVNGGAGSVDGLFEGTLTVVSAQNLAAPVPEPGSWAMLCAGMCLIGATLRRRAARG